MIIIGNFEAHARKLISSEICTPLSHCPLLSVLSDWRHHCVCVQLCNSGSSS